MQSPQVVDRWIADRMALIEASGIRRIFERARTLKNPVNLSIGQPEFEVPLPIREALHTAVEQGHNGYTVTQGIPELRELLLNDVRRDYPGQQRELLITSGTSGGLMLALLCVINPGDEVIVFDPYFVIYPNLIRAAGGRVVLIDTYPDFALDLDRVRTALSPRTKAVIVNSPSNPTGRIVPEAEMRDLARLCGEREILLISDEIYRFFCHETPFVSPARFNEQVLVVDGFSKSHGITGWRLGFVHGPRRLIEEMTKLQQFTFVCAPSMVQQAGLVAWRTDMTRQVSAYQAKRDFVYAQLREHYEMIPPGGAFYLFPKAPGPSATAFVEKAVEQGLLIIPGSVFSQRDSHFRISYAASEEMLHRGVEILQRLAR